MPAETYTLDEARTSITCLACKLTSHNPNDVQNKWCGNCKVFHEHLARQVRDIELAGHSVHVREILNGKPGSYALAELPRDLRRLHSLRLAVKSVRRRSGL